MDGSWPGGRAHPLLSGFAVDSDDSGWTVSTTALCSCWGWSTFARTRNGRPCHRIGCSALPAWRAGGKLLEDQRPSSKRGGPNVSGVTPLGDRRGCALLPLDGVLVFVPSGRGR
jgi:hypothetical protein